MNLRKPASLLLPLFTLIVFLPACPAGRPQGLAAEYTGKVVGVHDGDTLTLLTRDRQQVKIRLAEIDTPESRQPYGTRARQILSDFVFGKQVRVGVQDTDRYGRVVGRVYVGNMDVNTEMIRRGAAWVYRQYLKDQSLLALEAEAKVAKRGLWGLPEAERQPPWEWRQAQRSGGKISPAPTIAAPRSTSFTCGTKRYCKQMTSCEEAKFYLERCGVQSLDGNGDGVPCEAICK